MDPSAPNYDRKPDFRGLGVKKLRNRKQNLDPVKDPELFDALKRRLAIAQNRTAGIGRQGVRQIRRGGPEAAALRARRDKSLGLGIRGFGREPVNRAQAAGQPKPPPQIKTDLGAPIERGTPMPLPLPAPQGRDERRRGAGEGDPPEDAPPSQAPLPKRRKADRLTLDADSERKTARLPLCPPPRDSQAMGEPVWTPHRKAQAPTGQANPLSISPVPARCPRCGRVAGPG